MTKNNIAYPEPSTIVLVWEAVCSNCYGMLQRNSEHGVWWHQVSGLTACPENRGVGSGRQHRK